MSRLKQLEERHSQIMQELDKVEMEIGNELSKQN